MNALDLIALDAFPALPTHTLEQARWRAHLIGASDQQNGARYTDRALIYSRSGYVMFQDVPAIKPPRGCMVCGGSGVQCCEFGADH